jgi:branched-chain amino acid transport system substrate-binding protein
MPKLLIAQDAGYTDPKFVAEMGKQAEGALTRAPFALDLAARKPNIPVVDEMFKKLSGGRDMADVSARAFTGFLVLVDAINRAGSTEPAAVQKALRETNMPADQLLMPWSGVRFDEKGQNAGVRAILQQLQDGSYHTVYPFELATKEVIYPVPR